VGEDGVVAMVELKSYFLRMSFPLDELESLGVRRH
jgi:hypothetical protein